MWCYFVACPGLCPLSHSSVHINYIYMSQGEFSFFQYFSYWFHLAWIMLTESINHFNLALTGQVIFFPLMKQQHCQVSMLISWILLQSWKIDSINIASYMGRQYILKGSLTKTWSRFSSCHFHYLWFLFLEMVLKTCFYL